MYDIFLPNKKRKFTSITTADNDFLVLHGDLTFNQFKEAFTKQVYFYIKDIVCILDKYIGLGYGDNYINEFFK